MPEHDAPPAAPPATREELIAMVAKAHHGAYGDSTLAGRTLAAQSRLPKVIAENLGAGFGQWDFFPEPEAIVDFACGYVPPETDTDVWALARSWASDDAAGRPTLMVLVGREILQHELRRIAVPALRELFDETRPERVHALRTSLGLEAPAAPAGPKGKAKGARRAATGPRPPPAPRREIPTKMPKPVFVRPPPRGPEPPPRRFGHPKFGEGVLERQEGDGPDAKLTIRFEVGSKTLLARFVTEVPS